jgi:hypothetical protein
VTWTWLAAGASAIARCMKPLGQIETPSAMS